MKKIILIILLFLIQCSFVNFAKDCLDKKDYNTSLPLATFFLLSNTFSSISNGIGTSTKRTFPITKTGLTQCWDSIGNLISCSGTGQDGELQKGIAPSFTGPTAYGSDYITKDNVTGLIWKTCSEGLSGASCTTGTAIKVDWTTANSTTCNALNSANDGTGFANRTTWRLPVIEELETIINYNSAYLTSFALYFPATVASSYWSSSQSIQTNYSWFVNFDYGKVEFSFQSIPIYVRCVSN